MVCSDQGNPQVLRVFTYLCVWWSTSIHVKAVYNSLKPGDTLDSATELCSKQGKYCMSFLQVYDNLTYLKIYAQGKDNWAVWIANRNQPVDPDSAVLLLDHSGVLKIESKVREPMILYSSPQPVNNSIEASLLDSGNFVVQQLQPNGKKSVLWQSFDYPTDSLLPEMKLGVNLKIGHNWSLVSWFAGSIPAAGVFRLEWEPRTSELVIKHREQVYWTSGELRNNRFEHISSGEVKYNVVSTQDEESFSFTTLNEELITKWTLLETGQLINREGNDIARADMCYGYSTDEGCQKWEELPICRHHGNVFVYKTGYPNFKLINDLPNGSYSIRDCQAICWSNCSCVGFTFCYHFPS